MKAREKFGFLDYFDDLEDPRVNRTKIYPLNEILFIVICAIICGADSWRDFVDFGETKFDYLSKFFSFNHGIPSKNTFALCFSKSGTATAMMITASYFRSLLNYKPS